VGVVVGLSGVKSRFKLVNVSRGLAKNPVKAQKWNKKGVSCETPYNQKKTGLKAGLLRINRFL
jgi:hypothetical protein